MISQEVLLSHLAWFLASLGLLLLAFVAHFRFSYRMQNSLHKINATASNSLKTIQATIEERLRPTIHIHDSKEMVTRRAAEIISAAAEEEKAQDRTISFYGAASLSAQAQTKTAHDEADESAQDYYNRALEAASRSKVQMRRYISLFSPEEIATRRPEVQQQYLSWLKRQQAQIANDELYQLIDVVRAPKWGSNMARIITKKAMMEITGNGEAAVIIEDEDAAKTIRDYARKAVIGDRTSKNPARVFGLMTGEESVSEFRNYVQKIEGVVERTEA